jgi:hypothetical protein
LNVLRLSAFVTTCENDDQSITVFSEVDAVTGTIVDPQFRDTFSNRLYISREAERKAEKPGFDPSISCCILSSRGSSAAAPRAVPDPRRRVTKALLENRTHIKAVRFPADPEPEYVGVDPEDLPY